MNDDDSRAFPERNAVRNTDISRQKAVTFSTGSQLKKIGQILKASDQDGWL